MKMRLADIIGDRDERGLSTGKATRAQVLREALARQPDDRVGRGEDRLYRPIILFKLYHGCGRNKLAGEVENVAHIGCPEAIDGLGIIPDHGQAGAVWLEAKQDGCLQGIGVWYSSTST